MWRHEVEKKGAAWPQSLFLLPGATQEMPCTTLPLGDECDEESRRGNKRWVDQKCEWRVA